MSFIQARARDILPGHTSIFCIYLIRCFNILFQIGPWHPPSPGNITAGYPLIRWQQTKNFGYVPNSQMKNVFMAVAVDVVDWTGILGP